ncbi:hypothetical protein HMPREF3038_02107 [Akkermansia sp. KLE1797]|nr:hypothetical protein HMPREF3038_02107 [Akkermansia sp. KLE1797]
MAKRTISHSLFTRQTRKASGTAPPFLSCHCLPRRNMMRP